MTPVGFCQIGIWQANGGAHRSDQEGACARMGRHGEAARSEERAAERSERLVLRLRGALFRCVGHALSCVFQIAVRRPVATRSKHHPASRFFLTAHESESASALTHVERLRFPIRTTALRQRATPRRTHTCGVRRAAAGAVAAFSPSSLDCQGPRHLTTGERGPGYKLLSSFLPIHQNFNSHRPGPNRGVATHILTTFAAGYPRFLRDRQTGSRFRGLAPGRLIGRQPLAHVYRLVFTGPVAILGFRHVAQGAAGPARRL